MMNNSTETDTFNETVIVFHINRTSQLINVMISIVTVGFNGSMVLYLVLNRRRFKNVLWYQLMTFGISDGVAGLSPSLLLLFKFESINTNTLACGMIVITFHMVQLATLLNLCQLSTRRFYVLQSSRGSSDSTLRIPIFTGLASWGLSCLFVYPCLHGLSAQPSINGCASPFLFGTVERNIAITIYYAGLLTVTILVLNVFYFIMLFTLRHRWRRVIPSDGTLPPETADLRATNTTVFGGAQRRAWVHLCVILIATNLTMWPYIIMTILLVQGTLVYDGVNMPLFDIHMLCLNSLFGPILNVLFVRMIRKDFSLTIRALFV